jgi:AraC-like DNA-binding protein
MIHGVPDGCIDLILHCHAFETSYLIGIAAKPILHPLKGQIRYFGVRFLPGRLQHFFPFPPDYKYDSGMALSDLIGTVFQPVEEQILSSHSFKEQVRAMETFLLHRIAHHPAPHIDARVLRLLEQIYRLNGHVTIERLAKDERMSVRHLHRLFRSAIGLSPKTFSRVIRFQRSLRQITLRPHSKLVDIALENGYFDQAHFMNDFKFMYGKTPSTLIRPRYNSPLRKILA